MVSQERLTLRIHLATLPPDAVLTSNEAATYCGIGGSTWGHMRAEGKTPSPIRLTTRTLGYRKRDLDAWLDARTEQPGRAA